MEKIYGNEDILSSIDAMFSSERIPHSFLIFGEKGLGKKKIADYIASRLVESERVHAHPDVIYAEHEGKLQGFKADHVRHLMADAFITPNDAERKVYIFTDCDNMSSVSQNALLKVVEEPPQFSYFIFTVSSKDLMLSTILSRVVSLGATECSEEDTKKALTEKGFSEEDIRSAVSAFHGNIGKCESYIADEKIRARIEIIKNIADSIAEWNEYNTLKFLSAIEGERSDIKESLYALAKIMRDASVSRFSGRYISCYPEGAKKISEKISSKKIEGIYLIITESIKKLDTNVSAGTELASLCGQIYNLYL